MVTDMLNINKETARDILKNYLGKRKICSRFVPHGLTPEKKKSIDVAFSLNLLKTTMTF
jgi:hypothetical protein